MRRQGASVFVYVIFVALIVAFAINFGPQSLGSSQGCTTGGASDTAIVVNGNSVRFPTAFRAVFSFLRSNSGRSESEARGQALEMLVRRELLATEAKARGLEVTEAMVHEEIKRGAIFIGGQRINAYGQFFDEEGFFQDKRGFSRFVAGLNVTRSVFIEEQRRELLAALVAESMRDSVVVSRDEALAEFLHENNTATYDVVSFSPRAYRNSLLYTEEDLEAYAASHATEIAEQFKNDERLYKALKPQVRVRQIFVATAPPPETGAPAPTEATPDAAKAKVEAARADITSGKRTFAAVAKELSTSEVDRARSGDLGWRTLATPALSETALNEAVKTLKVGEVSQVITTERGAYLITVEGTREGDLTLDQVKTEIAVEQAKDAWSKEAARRAAIAALDAAQKSDVKNLNQLYRAPTAPDINFEQLLNDPKVPPDLKQKLRLEYLKQQGDKGSSLTVESDDVPAAWAEDPAAPAGGAPAADAPAAGATATAPGSAPAAAPDLMAPSTERLPALATMEPPSVRRIGPTPRSTNLPDLGSSAAAARAVFDELAAGELAKQIFDADGTYVVVQLIERGTPKMEDFDKDAEQRIGNLRELRGQVLVEGWLKAQCLAAAKANRIKPNPSLTRETDDDGKPVATVYRPCMSFR
ncbi:MAG: SurA N-terminal domain-containing protein [Kofleriaceae bacterium]